MFAQIGTLLKFECCGESTKLQFEVKVNSFVPNASPAIVIRDQ